jgi:hypothetical protein
MSPSGIASLYNKKEKVDNKFITDLHEDLCKHCTVSVDKELSRKITCTPLLIVTL